MKDLIDREKALDCFHDWVDKYGDVHTADEMTEYQAIEALPTEKSLCALCQYNDLGWDEEPCESCTMGGENNHFKAVERWISCSDKLPKREKDVLVTRHYLGEEDNNKSCYYVEVAARYGDDDNPNWISYSDEYKIHPKNHIVVAWKELPKPYKGEKNE